MNGTKSKINFWSSMLSRRQVLLGTLATAAVSVAKAQSIPFAPNARYPDPSVQILDPSFTKYRIYSSTVEQVATGFRWTEGPAYFPKGGYLLFSDIPNNRIMKFDESTGKTSVFRRNSNYSNGNVRDRQGRLITCEHSVTRRVTRTEHDGKITVLADNYQGKRLNAPNDVVVKSDDSVWFTDPTFGINGNWEGVKAKSEQATHVYRIDKSGAITAVITDIVNPNGLAFSPDEKKFYVVEWKGTPNRSIWVYDVADDGMTLSNKTKFIDAADQGALDGFKVDKDGNLWVGWGSNGAIEEAPTEVAGRKVYKLKGQPENLDGVMVFNPAGKAIGFIKLPERCPNLTFGGPRGNRLYMASSHSVYALYVETEGAV